MPCFVRQLPDEQQEQAAAFAVVQNPANAVSPAMVAMAMAGLSASAVAGVLSPQKLAFLKGRFWGSGGVDLTVGFLDQSSAAFRNLWLAHANSWNTDAGANVKFRWTQTSPDVRLTTDPQGGHWSYLGVDIRHVQGPTMNLGGFTARTPDAEWRRVCRHEVGHTLGAPHEHLRAAIVGRLDPRKTLAYFRRYQGWDDATIRSNVLTPLEESSILGRELTDEDSLMAYQLPGEITRDGRPVKGGADFSPADKAWAAKVYPLAAQPPPVEPPPGEGRVVIEFVGGKLRIDGKDYP